VAADAGCDQPFGLVLRGGVQQGVAQQRLDSAPGSESVDTGVHVVEQGRVGRDERRRLVRVRQKGEV
jgi:hypothetical protein